MKEKFRSFGAAVKQKADKATDGFARLVVKKRLLFTVIFALIFLCLITAGAILCKRKRLYWLVTSGSALIIYLLTLVYTYAYLT